MSQFLRRLRYLLQRRRFDEELANDLEFHREMAAREGRRFGNTLQLREEAREAWGWTWMDRLAQDVRYTARTLRRSPGFTLVAVLMLAVGIGINVAAFSFFNLLVLRPLPVRDPATLLQFDRSSKQNYSDNLPYPHVAFYREHSKTLSAVLAMSFGRLTLAGEEKPLNAKFVTANFLSELGAGMSFGRTLDPARDDAPGAAPAVVLGYEFWQSHFSADPSVVGRTIHLNKKPATVVGVTSREFSGLGLGQPDVWAPIGQQPYFQSGSKLLTDFSGSSVFMFGRLQRGLAPKVAEEELKSLAAELRRQHPSDIWENETLPSRPAGYAIQVRREMYPLLGLVGALVLLILAVACGNLGSLLLARGVARDREIAIRVSVGAGRARLIRQLFTESLVLALLGSAAGLSLGSIVLRILMALTGLPPWLDATPDGRVIFFAITLGFTSAILFGLTPALQLARQRHGAITLRQVLIGAQVAASCVLLIVAGLLVRAMDRALSTSPGFSFAHVITIDPSLTGYTPAEARTYLDTLNGRLRRLPGVESVSVASNPPLGNRWTVNRTQVAGRPMNIHFNNIDPQFFQTMSIPLLAGRNLTPGDTRAVIVSESLARLQWPSENPLGKAFPMGTDAAGAPKNSTVVGVAGSARLVSPEDSDAVEVYQLASADSLPAMVVLVKTSAAPEDLLRPVSAIAKDIDPKLFPEVQLMQGAFREKVQMAEYSALTVTLLGGIALLIACLGIVGMVAYAVSQRTREIGIRVALGARRSHVLSIVLRQFSHPVLIGLLAGAAGAAALSRVLRQTLYGISNLDAVAYLSAIGIFALTAAVAALWPARQALRVDPAVALRQD